MREGKPTEEIHKLIEEDQDIAILVLAAGAGKEGPGPLVASIAGKGGRLPDPGDGGAAEPVATRKSTASPDANKFSRAGNSRACVSLEVPLRWDYLELFQTVGLRAGHGDGDDVHPDRGDPEPGDAEISARQGGAGRRHRRFPRRRAGAAMPRRWPGGCSTFPASPACSSATISSPSPRTDPNGSTSSRPFSARSWSTSCRASR